MLFVPKTCRWGGNVKSKNSRFSPQYFAKITLRRFAVNVKKISFQTFTSARFSPIVAAVSLRCNLPSRWGYCSMNLFHMGSASLHPCLYSVSLTGLRPGGAEEVVDEGGGVADVDVVVLVAVGIVEVDGAGVAAQQVVDEGGDIGDIDVSAIIGVAA